MTDSSEPAAPLRIHHMLVVVLAVAVIIGVLVSAFDPRQMAEAGIASRLGLSFAAAWMALAILARWERHRKSERLWSSEGQLALVLSFFPALWVVLVSVHAKVRYFYTAAALTGPSESPWIIASLVALILGLATWSLRDAKARGSAWGWIPLLVPLTQAPFVLGVKSLPW